MFVMNTKDEMDLRVADNEASKWMEQIQDCLLEALQINSVEPYNSATRALNSYALMLPLAYYTGFHQA